MTKHYCDSCGKELSIGITYDVPIINKNEELTSIDLQLCEDCCKKFNNFLKDFFPTDVYEELQESVSWDKDDLW